MAYVEIKNRQGVFDKRPPAGYISWLGFWEKKKKRRARDCEVKTCNGNADIGGQVVKTGETNKGYILPLCANHNSKSGDEFFEAWENDLVPLS